MINNDRGSAELNYKTFSRDMFTILTKTAALDLNRCQHGNTCFFPRAVNLIRCTVVCFYTIQTSAKVRQGDVN